jgi:UDP-glucuronate decarboxylase
VDPRGRALEGLVSRDWPALGGSGAERLRDGPWRVVVTGAGGWLGLATLELLAGLLGERFEERVVCFGGRGRTLRLRGGVEIAQAPLAAMADLPPKPSLVLHLAFVTQGPAMTLDAQGYVAANRALAAQVLSALDRIGAEAVFQASSGAAYLADPGGGPQSKALYGWLKREDEAAFADWAARRGARAAIGRIFNLSGPYINRRSTYALASFIADALAGRPVRVGAATPVWRSYVAIATLTSVAAGVLTGGSTGVTAFETAGEQALEVGELAQLVAATLDAPGVARPAFDPAAAGDRYVGDGRAFADLARIHGVAPIDLVTQIRQTAAFMADYPEGG